jgi:hypothetical protein
VKTAPALASVERNPSIVSGRTLDPDPDLEPEADYGAEEMGTNDGIGPDVRKIADPQAYREHAARLRRERTYIAKRRDLRWYGQRIVQERRLLCEPTVPSRRNILRRKREIPRSPRA